MFGLIRKKKVKDAIEHILNEHSDLKKSDPLFKRYGDQYHYYMGNQNAANYIAWKCGIGERKDGERNGEQ